ncbi:MAG: helix-turn-helix domain-containing protein [Bacteroidota bacterium]|nr:helix-turn-helix domain-containing protein [Bacteroidota bacterium]
MVSGLNQGIDPVSILHENIADKKTALALHAQTQENIPESNYKKGNTQKESLLFFKKGKSIDEIAKERNLARTTIFGHIASFIETGEVDIKELIAENKLKIIQETIDNHEEGFSLKNLKESLGEDYSYGELRAAVNYINRLKEAP